VCADGLSGISELSELREMLAGHAEVEVFSGSNRVPLQTGPNENVVLRLTPTSGSPLVQFSNEEGRIWIAAADLAAACAELREWLTAKSVSLGSPQS